MSLVVVDPDEDASASFCEQLKLLGYDPIPVTDLKLAIEICEHSHAELLICSEFDWAKQLAATDRRLPVVVTSQQDPSSETLLDAMRNGISDLWRLPVDDDFLAHRIQTILARSQQTQSQAEARLNQYVADLHRDQRAGRYIQMGMLPPNPMAIEHYRLQHRIVPSLILSGDFVDYFRLTDRYFAFYIADVSGHGASSAFVTVLLKNFSRRLRREYRPTMLHEPGEILEWINRELLEQNIDKHVVIVFAIGDLEQNSVCLVNAGHFPPAILVNEAGASFVEQRGKPVGLFDVVKYESRTVKLAAGDRLVFFSDGVLDAMDGMDLSQKEAVLLRAAGESAEMDAIWAKLGITEDAVPDDMTCLTVRRES